MDEMSSAKFRTGYAKLARPTVVTVNGHPIGTWVPLDTTIDDRLIPARWHSELGVPVVSFDSRPFTPAPKPSAKRK